MAASVRKKSCEPWEIHFTLGIDDAMTSRCLGFGAISQQGLSIRPMCSGARRRFFLLPNIRLFELSTYIHQVPIASVFDRLAMQASLSHRDAT